MMPTEDHFRSYMKDLNVGVEDYIVLYDKVQMMSAPRALWMLRNFGAKRVFLLDGDYNHYVS
jgi:thiosulfate/3-mercaptopyruvate sulfurtransferase